METLKVTRTTYTENEVFGTSCGDCGWSSFAPITPRSCGGCGGENLESAEGCEIPYDDHHSTTTTIEGSIFELAKWLRDRAITEYDGGSTIYPVDGSHVIDYAEGRREEIVVASHDSDLLCLLVGLARDRFDGELISLLSGAIDAADTVNDHALYR